jgi:CheY-like chemotaxis protein
MSSFRDPNRRFEEQEKLLHEKLGRELTAREKFYVAFAESCAPRRGKPPVLCVEDNEAQLQMRKEILENDGFLVVNASNAKEAIEIVREAPVSLVLSDHMLSGQTGTQLAGEIKKIKPELPIVLFAGRSPESMQNVDCFINKTEPVARFLVMIRDLVNRYWA